MGGSIEVVDYDPAWEQTFELVQSRVVACLGKLASRAEHVGSTSVPGLASKPIVDVDVLLVERDDLAEAVARLERLGYRHEGNLGIEGREAFAPPADVPVHHLYICLPGAEEFNRHLTFRNYLRTHPELASRYGRLKKRLARKFREDPESYTEGKTAFVEAALRRATANWVTAGVIPAYRPRKR